GLAVPVSAADVVVTPRADGDKVGLDFRSTKFEVFGSNFIFATLDYTIDPPPPILDDFDVTMDAASPVAPGTAIVTTLLCAGDLLVNDCARGFTAVLRVSHFGTSSDLFDSVRFPAPVNLLDVRTTFELRANGASSQINGISQSTRPAV